MIRSILARGQDTGLIITRTAGLIPDIWSTYKTFAYLFYKWDNVKCDWLDWCLWDGKVPDITILSAKLMRLAGMIFFKIY